MTAKIFTHGVRFSDDRRKGSRPLAELLAEDLVLHLEVLAAEDPLDGQPDLIIDEGFGNVIRCAGPHGLDGRADRSEGGHHDHRCFRADLLGLPEDLETVHFFHLDVGHDDIEIFLLDTVDGLFAVVGLFYRIAFL